MGIEIQRECQGAIRSLSSWIRLSGAGFRERYSPREEWTSIFAKVLYGVELVRPITCGGSALVDGELNESLYVGTDGDNVYVFRTLFGPVVDYCEEWRHIQCVHGPALSPYSLVKMAVRKVLEEKA